MISISLKEYRNIKNLSQQQLADKCEVSQAYISRLESNAYRYKDNNKIRFIKLCEELQLCPSELIKYRCSYCTIKTTKKERVACRQSKINKGCQHMFLLDEE